MAPALVAAIPAIAAVGGAAMQSDANKKNLDEQRLGQENARIAHSGDAMSAILQNYGSDAERRNQMEANAIRTILSGF